LWCTSIERERERESTVANINLVAYIYATGTGTNACYVEKLENVEMWDGDDQPPRQVRVIIVSM